MSKVPKKHQYSKGVREQINDVDYLDKLPPADKEWMEQFLYEYYGNGSYHMDEDKRILNNEDDRKEARRNNNRTNRDTFPVALKQGYLKYYGDFNRTSEEPESENDWRTIYKYDGKYKAFDFLINDTLRELDLEENKHNVISLIRVFFKIRTWLRWVKKETRK